MSKSLEEQLKYAHEQFDMHLDTMEWDLDHTNLRGEYAEISCAEYSESLADMWLSIINSLTLLMEENSQTLELEAAMERKELIYAKAGIK